MRVHVQIGLRGLRVRFPLDTFTACVIVSSYLFETSLPSLKGFISTHYLGYRLGVDCSKLTLWSTSLSIVMILELHGSRLMHRVCLIQLRSCIELCELT
jgi:hypothetical protein